MSSLLKETRLSVPLVLKNMGHEGYFSGYASVFETVDCQGDRVLKGAFQKSLSTTKVPKMLWQHDAKEPIGLWHTLREDHKGLYVEGQLLLELQRGREAYSLLKKGVLDGLSIGCTVQKSDFSEEDGVREIKDADLVEISLVTFAANQDARVMAVKNGLREPSSHESQETLLQALQQAVSVLQEA